MKIARLQIVSWDRVFDYESGGLEIKPGDRVIIKTDSGQDIALVLEVKDASEGVETEKEPIVRMVTLGDLEKLPTGEEKNEAIRYAISLKKKYDLPMKFVDAHFSYDGSKVTFAFIADGRVDFREMLKDLTRHFGKSIRLQQIGIRDEARICGDCGHCGKTLCCKSHLRELASITSEMAELQECSHRGSDRISGVCGRLLCCLAYEQAGYEYMAGKMPAIGAKVSVDGQRGSVVGIHPLKRTVNVEFADKENKERRNIVEIDLDRNKKK